MTNIQESPNSYQIEQISQPIASSDPDMTTNTTPTVFSPRLNADQRIIQDVTNSINDTNLINQLRPPQKLHSDTIKNSLNFTTIQNHRLVDYVKEGWVNITEETPLDKVQN